MNCSDSKIEPFNETAKHMLQSHARLFTPFATCVLVLATPGICVAQSIEDRPLPSAEILASWAARTPPPYWMSYPELECREKRLDRHVHETTLPSRALERTVYEDGLLRSHTVYAPTGSTHVLSEFDGTSEQWSRHGYDFKGGREHVQKWTMTHSGDHRQVSTYIETVFAFKTGSIVEETFGVRHDHGGLAMTTWTYDHDERGRRQRGFLFQTGRLREVREFFYLGDSPQTADTRTWGCAKDAHGVPVRPCRLLLEREK